MVKSPIPFPLRTACIHCAGSVAIPDLQIAFALPSLRRKKVPCALPTGTPIAHCVASLNRGQSRAVLIDRDHTLVIFLFYFLGPSSLPPPTSEHATTSFGALPVPSGLNPHMRKCPTSDPRLVSPPLPRAYRAAAPPPCSSLVRPLVARDQLVHIATATPLSFRAGQQLSPRTGRSTSRREGSHCGAIGTSFSGISLVPKEESETCGPEPWSRRSSSRLIFPQGVTSIISG